MSSWHLFRLIIPWRELPTDHTPVAVRERFDTSLLRHVPDLASRIPPLLPILIAGGYIAVLLFSGSTQAPFCFNGLFLMLPLVVIVPSLLLWIVPIGLALGPIIAREREARSWEALRTTPFSAEEILLSKARGALWSMRISLYRLWSVQGQVLAAIFIGASAMLVFSDVLGKTTESYTSGGSNLLCAGILVLIFVGAGVYLADRAQQLVLIVVAILAASVRKPAIRSALPSAIIAGFLTWGIDTGAGLLVLLAQPPGVVTDIGFSSVVMILFGPLAGYAMELEAVPIVLAFSITVIIREIAIRGLWLLAVRDTYRL